MLNTMESSSSPAHQYTTIYGTLYVLKFKCAVTTFRGYNGGSQLGAVAVNAVTMKAGGR